MIAAEVSQFSEAQKYATSAGAENLGSAGKLYFIIATAR
jgi:hypothetical protein